MDKKKLIGYLNIAIKAGKVVFGVDAILAYRKKNYGVIICSTLSDNSRRKTVEFCTDSDLPFVVLGSGVLLSWLVSRTGVKAIAITNKQLYTILENIIIGGAPT